MTYSRSGRLLIVGAVVVVAAWAPDVTHLVHTLGGPSFPDALLALATLVTLGLSAWVLVVAALVTIGVSSRIVARLSPAMLRRALLAGAAGALAVGPAHAERIPVVPHSVDGLPMPDRPDAGADDAPAVRRHHAPRPSEPHAVAVRPGDTLWAIAARSLPSHASEARIARATTAWYRANRDVIGPDPDLIFPAQHLAPPTGKDHP